MDIKSFKLAFSKTVEAYLKRVDADLLKIVDDKFVLSLVSYIKKLALADGKRSRPYAAYLMYKLAGGKKDKDALNLFVSLEMLHLFALIHDDVMDNAKTRRGIESAAYFSKDLLTKRGFYRNVLKVSNSNAILLGDICFNLAYQKFYKEALGFGKNGILACQLFSKMINQLIIGQMLDVDSPNRKTVSIKYLENKNKYKTSSYTFVFPLLIGAVLAGKYKKYNKFCLKFGLSAGNAFQILDDALDILGNPKQTGKPIFSDLKAGQHTYFTQYVFKNGSSKHKQALWVVYGNKKSLSNKNNHQRLINLFNESGAIKYSQGVFLKEIKNTKSLLAKLKVGASKQKYKRDLQNLISSIEQKFLELLN